MDPSAAGPSAAAWLGAVGGLIGGLGAVGAALVAIVAITRQGRSAQAALGAQAEATRQAMTHERALAQDDRLWHRRAELYAQVLASRPVRQLVGAWVREMRESFDGDADSGWVRDHWIEAARVQQLAAAIRAELGGTDEAARAPGDMRRPPGRAR